MKLADFGIDPQTGHHDRRLTWAESRFVGILWLDHVGEAAAVRADRLAIMFFLGLDITQSGDYLADATPRALKEVGLWKRSVRFLQNHLLFQHDNIPVFSRSGIGGGYFIAGDDSEAEDFYRAFRQRGMTGLIKATRGKKASFIDAVEQLSFEFEDMVDQVGAPMAVRQNKRSLMPVEVVDAFLDKMTRDPEQFADGLRAIGEKYSSVLLPQKTVSLIQSRVAELESLVGSLGV